MPVRSFIGPPRLRPQGPMRAPRSALGPQRGSARALARRRSWSLLFLVVFVLRLRTRDFCALRYFGYRNLPPPSAFDGRLVGIGCDRDDVSTVGGACARECAFELRNRLHVLRDCTE